MNASVASTTSTTWSSSADLTLPPEPKAVAILLPPLLRYCSFPFSNRHFHRPFLSFQKLINDCICTVHFPDTRENDVDTVGMSRLHHIRHRIFGKSKIIPPLICSPCRPFHANTGRNTAEHDTGDTHPL